EGSMQRSGGVNMSIVYSGYTDYCDNFVYENDTLVKILLSEGYIACKDRTFHFYLKDHQGNNRVVANESGGIEQVNHYYPFGGLFGESSGGDVQKYKYGGKELERMHGVDLYDFSARMQDPVLGRFNTMDPMCEKYYSISPYAYCNNNPIMYIDPNGMDIVIWYQNERGKQVNFIFNGQNENNAPRNKFVNSVISAYNYNIKNGGGNNLKVIVTNAKIKIEIVETDKDNKYVSNNKGLIRFNPNAGLKLDDGNILSPATGLEHEAAHAVNDKFDKQNEKYDSKYGTKEEKNVIKGAELETARANGELPINHQGRESHSEGKWVVTKSVISNKEIDEKRSRELRKKIKDFKNNWTSE
ncbi:RHS repeat domain-containing protein, partial [Bacteroides sp. OM05-12]|uniref:RHS repeat domain-containing protein n=1 Tax=Bacteroides sp. OM05-12 TaxID=2292283 RepID=UPI000E87CCB6